MPCTYDETPEEIEARQKRENEALIAPYKAETDRVTAMLCGLLTKLEETGAMAPLRKWPKSKGKAPAFRVVVVATPGHGPGEEFDLDGELSAWWLKHKRADQVRRNRELRTSGLAKLSAAEKKALGLDDEFPDA